MTKSSDENKRDELALKVLRTPPKPHVAKKAAKKAARKKVSKK